MALTTALYIVIQSRGKWFVDFEGRAHGPHDTREAAAMGFAKIILPHSNATEIRADLEIIPVRRIEDVNLLAYGVVRLKVVDSLGK